MMPTFPVSARALRTATLIAVCLVAVTAEAADSAPVTVIRTLNDTYKAVLKQATALKYEVRYQKLEPANSQAFDFAYVLVHSALLLLPGLAHTLQAVREIPTSYGVFR